MSWKDCGTAILLGVGQHGEKDQDADNLSPA